MDRESKLDRMLETLNLVSRETRDGAGLLCIFAACTKEISIRAKRSSRRCFVFAAGITFERAAGGRERVAAGARGYNTARHSQ